MTKPTHQTLTALLVLTCVLLWAPVPAAATPGVRIAGPETLQLLDAAGQPQVTWTVESTIQDVLQIETTLYVACGPRGVLIYDLTTPEKPALVGRIAEGRNVVKLAQNGKSLLVVVADFSALTFSVTDPQKPLPSPLNPPAGGGLAPPAPLPAVARPGEPERPAAPGAAPRVPRASWATVTTVRGGWVAVTTNGPVQVGDRFQIHSQRRVRISDPTTSQRLYAPADQPTGMFRVSRVSGGVASGPLPRGTVAHVGDLAEPTADPLYAPKVAPKLWYGLGRFYGTLRPIIGVASSSSQYDRAPFALLNDFTLEYYFRVPIKLGVQVAPLGLVIGDRVGLNTQLRALISFASSYFEIGLEPGTELYLKGEPQFLVGYMVRLGSLDGLNLVVHNSYAVRTQFRNTNLDFSSFHIEANIPLASRFNLHLSGGGAPRWAFATIGLKYYARGGGGPGTVILSSGAGGAWFSDVCSANPNGTNAIVCQAVASMETFGPILSVGLDARF